MVDFEAETAQCSTESASATKRGINRRSYLKLAGGAVSLLGAASVPTAASESNEYRKSADDYKQISFEGDWKRIFTISHDKDLSVETSQSRDTVLCVSWPNGKYHGGQLEYEIEHHHGYQPDAAHARYWLYFPNNWRFHEQGLGGTKLPGFAGTYQMGNHDVEPAGYGGRTSDGTNGWSARPFNCRPDQSPGQTSIGLGSQIYHANDGAKHGAHPEWDIGFEKGSWHCIDQYVAMNTPGEADGVYRGWVDGELALEMNDLWFRNDGYGDRIAIQSFWMVFYFGGTWGSPCDQSMLFDDLELWLWQDRDDDSRESRHL